MLSRVAENLYWLGRYVERAENTARMVMVNGNLLLDLPQDMALGWQPLIAISGSAELYASLNEDTDERSVVRFLVADVRHPGSIVSSLAMARENCRTIRDIVPREVWEFINELYHQTRDESSAGVSKRGRHAYLRTVIRGGQTIAGMLLGTMSHDTGYSFLRAGRLLERGDMTARIVDVRSASLLPDEATGLLPFENIQWISVLKSLTAYQMYRQHLQVRVRRADALRFLLTDDKFPRAVYRCAAQVDATLERLPRSDEARRAASRLMRLVRSADLDALVEDNAALHGFVDRLQLGFGELNDASTAAYFLVARPAEALAVQA
jgi:uncharacterized alpha-E superfamily protein